MINANTLGLWSFTAAAVVWWIGGVWVWGSALDFFVAVVYTAVAVGFWCEWFVKKGN